MNKTHFNVHAFIVYNSRCKPFQLSPEWSLYYNQLTFFLNPPKITDNDMLLFLPLLPIVLIGIKKAEIKKVI